MTSRRFLVKASANVALVKYWGKAEGEDNQPATGSLSIGLDDLQTRTTVAAIDDPRDRVRIDGQPGGAAVDRVHRFLDLARERLATKQCFEVDSENNFPSAAGLASSASGFAALALGIDRVLGAGLTHTELSRLARQGSGSAARSVYGGFVEMVMGTDVCARQLAEAAWWPLGVVIAITSENEKAVGSSEAMRRTAATSPYYSAWLSSHENDMNDAREAVATRDFARLAEVSERSCLKMHAVIMSSVPPIIYWNAATVAVIQRVRELRATGVAAFFSMDAGAQVKVVCMPDQTDRVQRELEAIEGVCRTIVTRVGGAPCVEEIA